MEITALIASTQATGLVAQRPRPSAILIPKSTPGEPFRDADLRAVGYRLTHVFDYTLADGTLLYRQIATSCRPE